MPRRQAREKRTTRIKKAGPQSNGRLPRSGSSSDYFRLEVVLRAVFLAAGFFVLVFFLVDFLAVVFFAVEVFFLVDRLAVVFFFVVVFRAVDFFVAVFFFGERFAVDLAEVFFFVVFRVVAISLAPIVGRLDPWCFSSAPGKEKRTCYRAGHAAYVSQGKGEYEFNGRCLTRFTVVGHSL